jgi:hypothetical protein
MKKAHLTYKAKLQAYVLLESVLAMIVVMLCFGMTMMLYNTVISASGNRLSVEARIQLASEATRAKFENRLLDETIQSLHFRIEKKVTVDLQNPKRYYLHLDAINPEGKKLADYNEIIYKP